MKKYWLVFKKSLKSEFIYRSAAPWGIVGAMLSFLIQIFLWRALLGTGVRQDTSFPDMLLFVLINSFMMQLTRAKYNDGFTVKLEFEGMPPTWQESGVYALLERDEHHWLIKIFTIYEMQS